MNTNALKFDDGKRLLNAGFSIMVVDEDKKPLLSWKGLQQQAWTEAELAEQLKRANVWRYGLLTGYNGLFCIDVDLKVFPRVDDREPFFEEFISFIRDNVDSFDKKVAIYKTANFGYHLVYRADTDVGNVKLAKLKGHDQYVLETRGVGGYIVVYDDCTNKMSYTQVQKLTTEEHTIILEICKFFNEPTESIPVAEPKKFTQNIEGSGVSPWVDFNNRNTVFDVAGEEFEVVRTIPSRYIIKRHGSKAAHSGYVYRDTGCLFLFSTGTAYPNEKLLSPYALYTYKNHGGDFSASAKSLYEQGYGDRIAPKPIETVPPPIAIDPSKLTFPIGIFPNGIQQYILECNRTLDSSVDYMGVSMIWLLSVIVGNAVKVQVKAGWLESCIVWISCVGKAGLGKTPSVDNIVRPLQKINSREIKDHVRKFAQYKAYEALDVKEKKNTPEIREPKKKQFIVNDVTIEALVELHEENPNAVGVFKDELAGWIKDMNKYRAGSDLEFWLSSWSNKPVTLNRKTVKNTYVESPIIPVLGGIQPAILSGLFTAENKENGFVDRMLICYPDLLVEPYNENEISEDLLKWYSDYVLAMYSDVKNKIIHLDEDGQVKPHTVTMSLDAKKEWARIFNGITETQNNDDENEYMKSMLPKQKSYIPRFALLLNALDNYDKGLPILSPISKSSILKAEKLSTYFVSMAKKLKIDIVHVNKLKHIASETGYKSNEFDKFSAMLLLEPNTNLSEAAEILNVSRKTLTRWKTKISDNAAK